jgi:hypothetical protein
MKVVVDPGDGNAGRGADVYLVDPVPLHESQERGGKGLGALGFGSRF